MDIKIFTWQFILTALLLIGIFWLIKFLFFKKKEENK